MARAPLARKIALGVVCALLLLPVVLLLAANLFLQGPRLVAVLDKLVLSGMAGKVTVGSVTWPLSVVPHVLFGGRSPIQIDGVRVLDPEGTPVFESEHITCDVEVQLSPMKILVHDLRTGKSLWRFGSMKAPPGDNGFLAAFAPRPIPNAPPPPPPPPGTGSPFLFNLVSVHLDGFTAIFDFEAWGLELRNIKGEGSFKLDMDPKKPLFVGFDATGVDARDGGFLRILSEPASILPFDHVIVSRVATVEEWADDIFLDLKEAHTGASVLSGKGFFTGIYGLKNPPPGAGIDIHAQMLHAGDALTAVAKGHGVTGLTIGGDGAKFSADLKKTFAELDVQAHFEGLDATFAAPTGTYRALGLGFDLGFDAGGMKLKLAKFGFGAPGGGRFGLDLAFDLASQEVATDLRFDRFTTTSYLPRALAAMGGGTLHGGLRAQAGIARKAGAISRLNLTLQRARRAGLPPSVSIAGEASFSPELIKTDGIEVVVPGTRAGAKGRVALAKGNVDLALRVVAFDLGRTLLSLGLPPLARSFELSAAASGSLSNPKVQGSAALESLGAEALTLSSLAIAFGLDNGTATADLSAPALGGTLTGGGALKLWNGSTARMRKTPEVRAHFDGTDLDLYELLHNDALKGRLSFHAEAAGPLDKLKAKLTVPGGTLLSLLGQPWELGPIEADVDKRTVTLRSLRLRRMAGGTLDATGTLDARGAIALDLELDALDLEGLLGPDGPPLAGTVSADLHLGGTIAAPAIEGDIDVVDLVASNLPLGHARVHIATEAGAEGPVIVAQGDLFGRFQLDARTHLTPRGPSVTASLAFEHLVLEALVPALRELADAQGLASGKVTVRMAPGAPLAVDARLTELALSVAMETVSASGEPSQKRVALRNASDLHVAVVGAGDEITLDPVRFVTDGGQIEARATLLAEMTPGAGRPLDAAVDGRFDLALADPFVRAFADHLAGGLDAHVRASGTLKRPRVEAKLAIVDPIVARPVGFDTELRVPSGVVRLADNQLRVEGLAIDMEGSGLRVDGEVELDRTFAPKAFDIGLAGEVSGRLLELLAPDVLADAVGRTRVQARLGGTPDRPDLSARVDIRQLDFRLRPTGHEVSVKSGLVEVDNAGATLRDIKVLVDGQGQVTIGAAGVEPGHIAFASLGPLLRPGVPALRIGEVSLPLYGERLAYRAGSAVELNDVAFNFKLTGDARLLETAPADALALAGEVRIIAARFVQDFNVSDLKITPGVNESSVRPFYEGVPALEGLDLDLRVRTVGDALVVQNHIAPELHVDMNVRVIGTLAEPRIGGEVRPTDGNFKLPLLRGDFDLVPGASFITFVDTKSIAKGETPWLNLEAQSLVTDSAGADHNIRMRITGPIGQATIDLSSNDGLARNQVAILLASGRLLEEGRGTQNPTIGANLQSGTAIAGQASRDIVDDYLRPFFNDRVRELTGLDLRLTFGVDGLEGRLRKRISRYTRFDSSALIGFQSQRVYQFQLNQWLLDFFAANVRWEQRTSSEQQGLAETQQTANFELSWEWPIRVEPRR